MSNSTQVKTGFWSMVHNFFRGFSALFGAFANSCEVAEKYSGAANDIADIHSAQWKARQMSKLEAQLQANGADIKLPKE